LSDGDLEPGLLRRLVIKGLVASGIDVRPTGGPVECLAIGLGDVRCELTVEDCGIVHLDFRPLPGEVADAGRFTEIAAGLPAGPDSPAGQPQDLGGTGGGRSAGQARDYGSIKAERPRGLTLKGRVGWDLRARAWT
jgi:hypothetical protein